MKKARAIIKKSRSAKKPFGVSVVGKNGEPLVSSQLLSTRLNCHKNLRAVMDAFNGTKILVEERVSGRSYYLHLDGLCERFNG